ncbi:protein of unknown function [Litoreibacter ascidiaceicola]|uniref:DUF4123 domain-containing protein n=1 Tax=Litoreibacter ascidiaceicola TaxID=1486859 RepID=A0A1M4X273_9RHOB|nr:DUF4123 domain-containing protein [Litoreibacter ascidiaceicola]SHE87550.1 protein of unknown function [Litoreibacter ascidiaceicola]
MSSELDCVEQFDVVPLSNKVGQGETASVPEALKVPLFGALFVSNDETSPQTYAILDAAKVIGLPELLASSGLEHRCFYKGNMLDELGDVAPWIVRLEAENRLTRNLFTQGDAPWHLWDKEAGIFLRSSQSLVTLWRHFRKFTKVQNSLGDSVYFRFWEPHVAQAYLSVGGRDALGSPSFFHNSNGKIVDAVICCGTQDVSTVHYAPEASPEMGYKLTPAQERALIQGEERRRRADIATALRRCFPDQTEDMAQDQLIDIVGRVSLRMGAYGIRQVRNIHVLASWQLFYGDLFERRDPNGNLYNICRSELGEDAKLVQMQSRMDALHSAGVI